jgi:hypothetical protein
MSWSKFVDYTEKMTLKLVILWSIVIASNGFADSPTIFGPNNTSRNLQPSLELMKELVLDSATYTDNVVKVKAPNPLGVTWTMTLPEDAGTNNFVLTTNGGGVTSWKDSSTLAGGSPNTFAGFNGSGALSTIPTWSFDPTRFYGINRETTLAPLAASGTQSLDRYYGAVNPTADTDGTYQIAEQHEQFIGTDDAGFRFGNPASGDGGIAGYQFNGGSRNKSSWGSARNVAISGTFGNGADPISGYSWRGLDLTGSFSSGVTVGTVSGIELFMIGQAGSTVTNGTGYRDDSFFNSIVNYDAMVLNPTITTGNNISLSVAGGALGTVNNVSGYSFSPGITTSTGSIQMLGGGNNWGAVNGVNGVNFAPTITSMTGPYAGYQNNPHILTTDDSVNAFTDTARVDAMTGTSGYVSAQITPEVALTAPNNYTGIHVAPTTTGGQDNTLLDIDTTNMTGGAGNTLALRVNGRQSFQSLYDLTSGAGFVTPNSQNDELHIDSAITGTSDLHNLKRLSVVVGPGGSLDAGPAGIGSFSYLFQANLLGDATAGTITNFVNVASSLGFDPASAGGTINDYTHFYALGAPGGTFTVDNEYAFRMKNLGPTATTSHGVWIEPDYAQNYFAGKVGIGTTSVLYNGKLDVNTGADQNLVVRPGSEVGTTGVMLDSVNDLYSAVNPMVIRGAPIALSGNVGINTLTPSTTLDVSGSANITNSAQIGTTLGVGGVPLFDASVNIKSGTDENIAFRPGSGLATTGTVIDSLNDTYTAVEPLGFRGNPTTFYTAGGTPVVTIDGASGKAGFGTASPAAGVTIGAGTPSVASTTDDIYVTGTAEVAGKTVLTDAGGAGGNVPHAVIRRSSTTATSATCAVTCSANEVVLGGGCVNTLAVALQNSYPSAAVTYSCTYLLATGDCTAWAICAKY